MVQVLEPHLIPPTRNHSRRHKTSSVPASNFYARSRPPISSSTTSKQNRPTHLSSSPHQFSRIFKSPSKCLPSPPIRSPPPRPRLLPRRRPRRRMPARRQRPLARRRSAPRLARRRTPPTSTKVSQSEDFRNPSPHCTSVSTCASIQCH